MPSSARDLLDQCLLLDIEVNEKGEIYSLGAVYGEQAFPVPTKTRINRAVLENLDAFAAGARFVLGHNILNHDIPRLQQVAPSLRLFLTPRIDTLFLSPLAYPANPYHRLIKNYQIVRDSINDPVQDALLAGKVFTEQWDALEGQWEANPEVPLLYRGCLAADARQLAGTAEALGAMGIPLLPEDDVVEAYSWFARKHACISAVDSMLVQLLDGALPLPPLAYVVAWLSVSGGNSVLPPWVRHQFPQVPLILQQLRENLCQRPDCSYCQNHHNPQKFLLDYYGFPTFRAEPATEDGKSLQEEIVTAAARGHAIFATLPTGGGKSLCYLLPALMRYHRRNLLTIIISPLQALMKDQVDNFSRLTGTKIAAALYGMLTMPERAEVLEAVRLGDIGILLVSPEQLRNRSFLTIISQREVGAWVFDEAHCLSKWGHDFRPDYLYAIRFIREFAEREKSSVPLVQCFTATAKKDVKAEIIDLLQRELGLRMVQFAGGHERTNLHYEVYDVEPFQKFQAIVDILRSRYEGHGSVVIYCATRKTTEKLAEHLQHNGYVADAFHAGLEPSLKKRIQENFISGVTPIICATNAFGMGIDKEDVRIVIHADIPGSLENYLQEAGRAGRDRNAAECVLIFNEQDIEGQFRLSCGSMLNREEIAQFLRGIRYAARGENTVVLTAGDLLRLDVVEVDPDIHDGDTRVRTALAWLERAGYLQRNENQTRIFQGKPTVRNLAEAAEKISALNLSERQKKRWLAILGALMERNRLNQAFSADELAGLSAFAPQQGDNLKELETQRVIRTLHDMSAQGILEKLTLLSAYIRYKVQKSSEKKLREMVALELDFLKTLEAASPDVEVDTRLELDLRQVNQMMLDAGHGDSSPHALKLLLYGLSRDGKGLAGAQGSLSFTARGNNRFAVYLHRDWPSLRKTVELRQLAAHRALIAILAAIPAEAKPSADLLVEFTLEQLIAALRGDLLLVDKLKDPLAAAERALTFMHEQRVIDLQQGLAVFRQAMTIQLHPDARRRQYTQGDFAPLKTHYSERTFQIHVMNEYARLALTKISGAWQYVASYFNDDKEQFVKQFFPKKDKFLERATSKQSYQRIVDDLANRQQEKIVTAGAEKNMLILAGPGAGKTRVVAHRVAHLLRVNRVNSRSILVLCFNRSAILTLKRRLRDLVGADMLGVTMLTFHGLALRLVGRSLVSSGRGGVRGEIDFPRIITDAINLLKGDTTAPGFEDIPPDFALLGRFSHILVDEYQDIDGEQYELVSLLAGRSREEGERKMAILAVGDDDQNIYRFRGASVAFIKRFRQDYDAEIHYLVENYRSSAHIVAAANCLIAHNIERMKTGHPICVNRSRQNLAPGGRWQQYDPIAQGKVHVLEVENGAAQASVLLEELRRLQQCGPVDLANCAVLAREWKDLDLVRCMCEDAGVEVSLCWGRHGNFPRLTRIRENADILERLQAMRTETISGSTVLALCNRIHPAATVWSDNLKRILQDWVEESADTPQPVSAIEEYLYETLSEQGRSKSIGNGLFLATAHAVKGLEFDHVFILGDNWNKGVHAEIEDERRLYYVSMSRARETLHLFSLASCPNPHVTTLSGDFLLARKCLHDRKRPGETCSYSLLGMDDLFLDFAAQKAENHPARLALKRSGRAIS
jgi:ATP-dependent DNA helicase RecQ